MLGLESHDGVPRFGPEDAVDLTAVKPFLGKTVLRGGNGRVRRLLITVSVLVSGLVSRLVIVTILVPALVVISARIVVAVSIIITVVIWVTVAVTVGRIIPPWPPGIESETKPPPESVDEDE